MVPMTGFEPARRVALDPKSSVSAVPPHRHMVRAGRLELPRAYAHNDLNVACLPIPARPHMRHSRKLLFDNSG